MQDVHGKLTNCQNQQAKLLHQAQHMCLSGSGKG